MRRRIPRLSSPVAVLGLAAASLALAAQPEPPALRIIHEGDRATLTVRRLGGVEMVRLAEVAAALGGRLRPGDDERQALLRLDGRAIRFHAGRSVVLVGRTTRLLRDPSVRRGGVWFVPVDFVSRVLPDLLAGRSRYDEAERTLAVGADYPRLEVEIEGRPGTTTVTLRSDPPAPMEIETGFESGRRRIRVEIAAPFIETAFVGEAPRDGVVERVDLFSRGEGYILEITTGPNYGYLRQGRRRGQLEIDLIRGGMRADSGADVLRGRRAERPRRRDAFAPADVRIVAIDPGHGGPNHGAAASGVISEKAVTLAVALALRNRLERDLGVQVVLTRDRDREVGLDDRAAVANTARADLFVSIHLNASPSPRASGSLVYHQSPQAPGRADSGLTVRFVPWDGAQAPFVPASRLLAEAIAAELEELPIAAGGVAHAPLRLLSAAAMPAVQVELGFVTSAADREQLAAPEFHEAAARALAAGISRFRTALVAGRQVGDSP